MLEAAVEAWLMTSWCCVKMAVVVEADAGSSSWSLADDVMVLCQVDSL